MNTAKSVYLPAFIFAAFAAFLLSTTVKHQSFTTVAVVASSIVMFTACWVNAAQLFGKRSALQFVLLAVTVGWFAEQMGATHGWFFGHYDYTDVLGWRIGAVPAVIPMMWFALSYIAYVLANLIVLRSPNDREPSAKNGLFMSFLAAMLVTAFDLGADPYMVNVLKAWVMEKKDGWWFGETLQGFVGWVCVSFVIQAVFRSLLKRTPAAPSSDFSPWQALLPLGLYASGMVFQLFLGDPVETRTVAVFAMGIPLLCALAGWQRWAPVLAQPCPSPLSEARLNQMQYMADPLADNTIERVLQGSGLAAHDYSQNQVNAIEAINAEMSEWTTNASIVDWQPKDAHLPKASCQALQDYLSQGQMLPEWANPAQLARAEALFMDDGPLSCTLLFCTSLPECYVIPDLSAVLHATGQLDHHTDYRIRATAAMIFPVMMRGGLTDPTGGGVAQILKVRLIHATIRHLLLRRCPADAMAALGEQLHVAGAGIVSPTEFASGGMHQTLLAHGWKLGDDGLPCNQEELAYTLLTFGYVYCRSMRQLGLGLAVDDELAYLHCWNVVGHILGIRKELLPSTMAQAQALFAQMQVRGRARPVQPDPRPHLGQALMKTVAAAIPLNVLKPVPILLARHLCGAQTAKDIGIHSPALWPSTMVFYGVLLTVRLIDTAMRWVFPQFSLSRLLTRAMGYHVLSDLLLSQTRPLKLPQSVLAQVSETMALWGDDTKASARMNRLEDCFTPKGSWLADSKEKGT